MLGTYDFCGYYEWTFAWLHEHGGKQLVNEYWDEGIHRDSQQHASELIIRKGIEGMKEYWGHTLAQEGAGYQATSTNDLFRLDITDCPSKGFLIRNGLEQYPDYCDHCMGWIGPLMKRAGFTVDHQHNHCGQCWWEFRRSSSQEAPSPIDKMVNQADARLHPNWKPEQQTLDTYNRANGPDEKTTSKPAGDEPKVR